MATASEDVFSQQPIEDSDDDQADSFVVENDVVEYDTSPDELDFVTEFKAKKRRRIRIRPESSSSESEDNSKPPDKIIKTPPPPSPFNPKSRPVCGGGVIAVCATEISKCPEVISLLKHQHDCQIMMLTGNCIQAGFMLSPRLCVERWIADAFCNATRRQDLVAKCQTMNGIYTRPYLIVECYNKQGSACAVTESCQSVSLSSNQLFGCQPRTKYVDSVLCQLAGTNIRTLFSDSPSHTAQLIALLLKKEASKKFALPFPRMSADAAPFKSSLHFYRSLPGVTVGTALQLIAGYGNVAGFLDSARSTVLRKTHLSEQEVKAVQSFISKDFRPVINYS